MSHLFLYSILTFICILIAVHGDDDEHYRRCSSPCNYTCGPLSKNISYPFWANNTRPQYCGRQEFELRCRDNLFPTIEIGSQSFRICEINESHQLMRIARADILDNICTRIFVEAVIDHSLFSYTEKVRELNLFFDCGTDQFTSRQPRKNNTISCPLESERGVNKSSFYTVDDLNLKLENVSKSCSSVIKIPIELSDINIGYLLGGKLREVLSQGFEVRYLPNNILCQNCNLSQGICGSNQDSLEFSCLCLDHPQMLTCPSLSPPPAAAAPPPRDDKNLPVKLGIGFGAAFGGMAIMAAAFLIFLLRKKNKHSSSALFSHNITSDPSSKSDLEKGDNFLGVHVFSYTELEEATDYFDSSKELGDGGFGTVYYGELQDGRAVAVKRLYENNYKRVEQFMNEIEILARLRHQNLVSLYGCTSRHSRELLLVYEYISNGTVADHLHGERAKPGSLPWPTRLKIAIETASALTYLHASDIIHRDVKTNNILIDSNFCVKVADFGLSRLFPTHVTHVSTAPQGTPGYVDPEYHQCYRLTDKSDVFSFGVVLIELISSMPAVDITRHRHEINLSNMAINKIQNKALHELVDPTLGYESDSKVRKMINAVAELAFQCLQSEKDLRPYMMDVLETLKDIESDGYNKRNIEDMLTQSPDSVSHNWTSTKTTPNFST